MYGITNRATDAGTANNNENIIVFSIRKNTSLLDSFFIFFDKFGKRAIPSAIPISANGS